MVDNFHDTGNDQCDDQDVIAYCMGQCPDMKTGYATDNMADSPVISCSNCKACCCRLEVMLMGDDENVPVELTVQDQWGGWVMRRLDDGWCAALDRHTMKCTIYQYRPIICRDYQAGESDCLDQRAKFSITATD